jgi:hypothetical protein
MCCAKLLDVLCQKTESIHGEVVTPQTADSHWCEQDVICSKFYDGEPKILGAIVKIVAGDPALYTYGITIFRDVTPCKLLVIYCETNATCLIHLP